MALPASTAASVSRKFFMVMVPFRSGGPRFCDTYGAAKQAAEKVVPEQESCPRRLKPNSKQCAYRSGKPLRHPKAKARPTPSAPGVAAPLQNNIPAANIL